MPDVSMRQLLPLVTEHASATPTPLILNHMRKAAIELCKRARVWRLTATETVAANPFSLADVPTNAQIHKIERLWWGTKKLDARQFSMFDHEDISVTGTPRYWTQEQPDVFHILPFEAGDVTARLILTPRKYPVTGAPVADLYNIPDYIAEHYGQVIADGALASIMALPQSITTDADPSKKAYFDGEFSRGIGRALTETARGIQGEVPLRIKASWF